MNSRQLLSVDSTRGRVCGFLFDSLSLLANGQVCPKGHLLCVHLHLQPGSGWFCHYSKFEGGGRDTSKPLLSDKLPTAGCGGAAVRLWHTSHDLNPTAHILPFFSTALHTKCTQIIKNGNSCPN